MIIIPCNDNKIKIMPQEIRINLKSMLFVVLIAIGVWLVVEIRGILALLLTSFILMSALKPAVDKLMIWKLPRFVAILIIYIFLIFILIIVGSLFLPPLVSETLHLINNFPKYLMNVASYINLSQDTLLSQIGNIGQNAFRVTLGFFFKYYYDFYHCCFYFLFTYIQK